MSRNIPEEREPQLPRAGSLHSCLRLQTGDFGNKRNLWQLRGRCNYVVWLHHTALN